MRECESLTHPLAMMCKAMVAQQASKHEVDEWLNSIVSNDIEALGCSAYAARRITKRKGRERVQDGEDPPPRNMIEALMGDRAEEWVESIYKEFNGLESQGVFSHDHTKDDLAKMGITSKPVPCSIALTHKYKDGVFQKCKTRICIAGHKGNMTKGIHYDEVFAASPVQHTERILQAMSVNLHLHNLTWDISQAYTWAPLQPGERIAIVYPEGFKRYHEVTGEELFLLLERNLYGAPSAGRGWSIHRNDFIMKRFNQTDSNGVRWSCHKSVMDPCLFVIDRHDASQGGQVRGAHLARDGVDTHRDVAHDDLALPSDVCRTWLLIHTDDCDAYSTSDEMLHEINDIMNSEWKTEIVDSSYVLGVKRDRWIDDDGMWHIKMSMHAFITDLAQAFASELAEAFGRRTVRTPFPEELMLTKAIAPADGEIERNISRGYQRLVGSLLWCVRHVAPACAYGCSQLCKLMACPTDLAWHAALHMLQYLVQNSDRGIVFSESEGEPIAYVDASNKDDPADGRTQYGYSVHWGGPLIVKSGKLSHVGINSTYNEYMALHHCVKQVVWLRQLLDEIGLSNYITKPTLIYADNKQANKLCAEDLVTSGNMYFRTGFHYNKEAVRDKYVSVDYIHTSLNVSDILTKGLARLKIEAFEPHLSGHRNVPIALE